MDRMTPAIKLQEVATRFWDSNFRLACQKPLANDGQDTTQCKAGGVPFELRLGTIVKAIPEQYPVAVMGLLCPTRPDFSMVGHAVISSRSCSLQLAAQVHALFLV